MPGQSKCRICARRPSRTTRRRRLPAQAQAGRAVRICRAHGFSVRRSCGQPPEAGGHACLMLAPERVGKVIGTACRLVELRGNRLMFQGIGGFDPGRDVLRGRKTETPDRPETGQKRNAKRSDKNRSAAFQARSGTGRPTPEVSIADAVTSDGKSIGHSRSNTIDKPVKACKPVRPGTVDSLSSVAVIRIKIACFMAKARRDKNL